MDRPSSAWDATVNMTRSLKRSEDENSLPEGDLMCSDEPQTSDFQR